MTGHRLSVRGNNIRTFSWRARNSTQTLLKDQAFAARLSLVNKVFSIASTLDLTILDGRGPGQGLHYYQDVEHLLDVGKFPRWASDEVEVGLRSATRHNLYRAFAEKARGACFGLCLPLP